MTVAAFVVSILALLIALGSLGYTRQTARTNQERRHDERAPTVTVERAEELRIPHVVVTNVGREDLDEVVVRLLPPRPGRAPVGTLVETGRGEAIEEQLVGHRSRCSRRWTGRSSA
jgi:hypothetical protein